MFYIWMDVDAITFFVVCEDVGPRRREVDLIRVPTCEGPVIVGKSPYRQADLLLRARLLTLQT
jgi:hypothetical protein